MKNIVYLKVLYIVLTAGLLASCMGMEETSPSLLSVPQVKTFEVKDNGSLVFELTASVGESAIGRIASCGFYYGKKKDMSDAERIECKMAVDTFATDLLLREYGETFYLSSYISNGLGSSEICSSYRKITVGKLEDYVTFKTPDVSYDQKYKYAKVGISYNVQKGVEVSRCGLCYGDSRDLSISGDHSEEEDFTAGYINVRISDVEPGKAYYVRPYLYDGDELVYGTVEEIRVLSTPVVETSDVTDITDRGAVCGGRILDDGGAVVKDKGIEWGEHPDQLYNSCSAEGGDKFMTTITLKPNRVYYVRAYATNSMGMSYGELKTFRTDVGSVRFGKLSLLDSSSSALVISASLIDEGGESPSETGFYYSLSSDCDPMTAFRLSAIYSGGEFSAKVYDLQRATIYYMRAYAVNSAGEAVSDVFSFQTLAELPVVLTSEVTDVTDRSAVCGGRIVDDGGSITAKGVVWSTSSKPTVKLSTKINEGGGAAGFQSNITGLLPGTTYYVRAYASNSAGTSYGNELSFKTDVESVDTDIMQAANCFVISKSGTYGFKTVKGNSAVSVGTVKSAEVLWESFGTSTVPQVGALVKSVSCSNGTITFQTADTFREGNAVIAAKNASGTILWSWHIWFTDEPQEQVYYNNAGTMMDRNLGATSATPGSVGALGLLYQWGRKDPFLGSSSISSSIEAKSTITWPSAVKSSASCGTISYSVGHPTTFINYYDSNYDWCYTGSSSTDNTRWQSNKTIYDPCPAGWRVPDGGSNGVWAKAVGSSASFTYSYDSTKEGMNFSGKFGSASTIWYPAPGHLYDSSGSLSGVGGDSRYWSATPNGSDSYDFRLDTSSRATPSFATGHRAFGQSVRCIKE